MFNPTRLTLARKRRGHTKSSLAVKLGVDLRAVYAYESGEYPPAEDTLRKIQLVLDFPEAFFSGDDLEEPSPDTASFRAMTKMLSGQRDMALETGAIAFHINNWLESKFELPPLTCLILAMSQHLKSQPTPFGAIGALARCRSET